MTALYIHIPFCLKKCNYCDFTSIPYDAVLAASYVYALKKEIAMRKSELSLAQQGIETLYVGGGTPTCLTEGLLAELLGYCRQVLKVSEKAEITVECNPGTANLEKLKSLAQVGFNRISLGVQACQNNLLQTLGRIHGQDQVNDTVKQSRLAGFSNLSLDLMYGIPGQTIRDWQESLESLVALEPEHISAYNLKLEMGTKMFTDVEEGKLEACDEDLEVEMYNLAIDYLGQRGYRHYEISNFAKPGMESKHNLSYWLNREYLGVGVSAHSLLDKNRFSNVENVERYISMINENKLPTKEVIQLSSEDQVSEAIFLGLRLIAGINLGDFCETYGLRLEKQFASEVHELKNMGLLETYGGNLRLTKKGLLFSNEVFVKFV